MSSNTIMKTMNTVRLMTLAKVESIPEELFDIQPPQFNNTIRWQVGHIISGMDLLVFHRISQTTMLPEGFVGLFRNGTKPSDWTAAPPTKAELIRLLKKQVHDVQEAFSNRVDETLPTPIQLGGKTFETAGELIIYALFHEGQHLANVADLEKIIHYRKK